MVDIPIALASLKAALDIAKGVKDLNDTTARQGASIELMEKIITAQGAQSELIHEVRELEAEVTRLKDWAADKARYELRDVGQGCMAYALKEAMANGEQSHALCANCYTKDKKTVLQPRQRDVGRAITLECHECGSVLVTRGVWSAR
jgi:hypothetical protein